MVPLEHLSRLNSSHACSTSYSTAVVQLRSSRGRTQTVRHAAHPRGYHAHSSPERDPHHRPAPLLHRGPSAGPPRSAAVHAATVAPPSPSRDGRRSVPEQLSTSIPDSIPSNLQALHSRAVQMSRTRSGHVVELPPAPGGPSPVEPDEPNVQGLDPSLYDMEGDAQQADAAAAESAAAQGGGVATPARPVLRRPRPVVRRGASAPALRAATAAAEAPTTTSQAHHRSNLPRAGHTSGPRRGSTTSPPSVMQLTLSIKAVTDWRQLPRLLSELGPDGLDSFNAVALVTHLAQLLGDRVPDAADVPLIAQLESAVLRVVEPSLHEYRARQLSNLSWALARLGTPRGAAFLCDPLLAAAYPLLPWYEPQHLSNTIWALATAGASPDDAWLEEYLTVAYTTLQRRAFAPQHLANVLWGLERMGVRPDEEWMSALYDCVHAALPRTNGADVSSVLSSLALMGMHTHAPGPTAALVDGLEARLVQLLAPTGHAPSGKAQGSLHQPFGSALPPAAAAQRLAAQQQQLTPTPVRATHGVAGGSLAGVATAAAAQGSLTRGSVADVSDQTIANSMWALAVMGRSPRDSLWNAVVAQLRARLADPQRPAPGVQPAALPVVLWACSTLGRALPPAVTSLVYGRVRGPQLEALGGRGLATTVWALATAPAAQARPPADWVAEAVTAAGPQVSSMGPQSVSNLLYGLCCLGARPPPAWMSSLVNHFHRVTGNQASVQSVSNVLWSLAKMGYRLNDEGMAILAGLAASRLQEWQSQSGGAASSPPPFKPQELSNVLWAMASLGYTGDEQLGYMLLEALRLQMQDASPQDLSNVLWSASALGLAPSDAWMADYYAAAAVRVPTFAAKDLAQTLYAAAKLGVLPAPAPAAPPAPTTLAATRTARSKRRAAAAAAAAADVAAGGGHAESAAARSGAAFMAAALAAAPKLLANSNAQDLCNVSWALVQRGYTPDSGLTTAFAARLVALAGSAEPAQLALGVWALGKWRVQLAPQHMQVLEVSTFRAVPSMRPHELAALLSGFAAMAHTPPVEWLEDAVQQVAARGKEFGPQDWTVVLSALARIQDPAMSPQAEELVQRLLPRLHRLPLASLIMLSYSAGCMGPSSTARQLVDRCLARLAAGADAPHSAKGETAGAGRTRRAKQAAEGGSKGAGGAPGKARAEQEARPVRVSALSASEMSALLWAAVRVELRTLPHAFRNEFLRHTWPLLPTLPASLTAAYLWACGRLRIWLPSQWRRALVARALKLIPQMCARELSMCLVGFMWLRVWPSARLLARLEQRFAAEGHRLDDHPRASAVEALRVLRKRLALAGSKHRMRLRTPQARRAWAEKAAAGAQRVRKEAEAAGTKKPRPEGQLTRRGAIKQGLLRKRPARAGAAVAGKRQAEEDV